MVVAGAEDTDLGCTVYSTIRNDEFETSRTRGPVDLLRGNELTPTTDAQRPLAANNGAGRSELTVFGRMPCASVNCAAAVLPAAPPSAKMRHAAFLPNNGSTEQLAERGEPVGRSTATLAQVIEGLRKGVAEAMAGIDVATTSEVLGASCPGAEAAPHGAPRILEGLAGGDFNAVHSQLFGFTEAQQSRLWPCQPLQAVPSATEANHDLADTGACPLDAPAASITVSGTQGGSVVFEVTLQSSGIQARFELGAQVGLDVPCMNKGLAGFEDCVALNSGAPSPLLRQSEAASPVGLYDWIDSASGAFVGTTPVTPCALQSARLLEVHSQCRTESRHAPSATLAASGNDDGLRLGTLQPGALGRNSAFPTKAGAWGLGVKMQDGSARIFLRGGL